MFREQRDTQGHKATKQGVREDKAESWAGPGHVGPWWAQVERPAAGGTADSGPWSVLGGESLERGDGQPEERAHLLVPLPIFFAIMSPLFPERGDLPSLPYFPPKVLVKMQSRCL